MRPESPQQRTARVMSEMRRIVALKNLTAEGFRDLLNQDYLHVSDKVTTATVSNWLSTNKRPSTISSESILAIKEFIAENRQTQ